MFRLDGGQSSTLPSFSPVAGVHSSGLNKRLHLAAKTSDRHRQKPAVISAPLFSCSGAFTHASRRGHRRFRGTKNPRASNWRSRDYVTNLGPAGLSLLSPDRLLSLLDVCGCRVSRCSEYLYVRLARTVPHSIVHYSQARSSVSNAERPATGHACVAGRSVAFEACVKSQAVLRAASVASTAGRCGSSRLSSCGLGRKPTMRSTIWPSLNRIIVGMPVTPKCIGVCWFSSTF